MSFVGTHFTLTVDHREMLPDTIENNVTDSHTENRAIVKMAISLLRYACYMAAIFRVI